MKRWEAPCDRFRRLTSESRDRNLAEAESNFLLDHRSTCQICAATENTMAMALNMLKDASLPVETPYAFDHRLERNAKVQVAKDSFRYWTPALISAVAAAVIVFSLVGVLNQERQDPVNSGQGSSVRRMIPKSEFPILELESESLNLK